MVMEAARVQEIHPVASFPLLAETDQAFEIFEISFRPDGVLEAPESAHYAALRLILAVTPFDELILDFDVNLNDSVGRTVVYDGPATITTENVRLPGGTMAFDQTIQLQTPFPYSPQQGNLLIDFEVSATDSPPLSDFSGTGGLDQVQQVDSGPIGKRDGWTLPMQFSFRPMIHGDFDGSGQLDAADIDLLSAAIGTAAPLLDINQDGETNEADRQLWIGDLANTFPGDANLDGSVKFGDFVTLASAFGMDGGWSSGDFDGNGVIAFADFVALSEHFGSERVPASSVPEPAAHFLMGLTVLSSVARRRYRRD